MRFSKWHALGNAYLVVERASRGSLSADRVRRLCDRHTGIGADGVLEVVGRSGTQAEVVIWNPDGSVAEISGNGVRIAARWLAQQTGATEVTVQTSERAIQATMLGEHEARTDLGQVVVGEAETIDVPGGPVQLFTASVGNPHAVIRLDDPTRDDLLRLGPAVETHARFPERTNVQLVRVDGPHDLVVLVWERGAGETSASGSSSVAAAAVAIAQRWCETPVTVHLPGGTLTVEVESSRAIVTGPAEEICQGTTAL